MKAPKDPIVEEIHAIREAIAKTSGNDMERIAEAARARQAKGGAARSSACHRNVALLLRGLPEGMDAGAEQGDAADGSLRVPPLIAGVGCMDANALIAAFGAVLVSAQLVLANGPEIGRDAGMIFPLESTTVRLSAESVDVRCDLDRYWGTARCVYYLSNLTDSLQAFEMAFVTNQPAGEPGGQQRFYRDIEMVVDVDGVNVPTRLAPVRPSSWVSLVDPAPDSLPAWNMAIRPQETVRVHMAYRVSRSGGSDGDAGDMGITYRCRPAALWAGTIGQATIRFHLGGLESYLFRSLSHERACISVHPAGWRRRGEDFEWSFKDWEPTEDVGYGVSWQ